MRQHARAEPPQPRGRLSARQWAGIGASSLVLFVLLLLDVRAHGLVARLDEAVSGWAVAALPAPTRSWAFERVLSAAGGFPVVEVAALAFAASIWRASRPWALAYLAAVGGTRVAVALLKEAVARPRPEVGLTSSYAFPSGHSAAAAVTFLLGVLLLVRVLERPRRWARPAAAASVGIVLLTGAGRVLAGVHYPSDVAAGFLLGILATSCVLGAWRWRREREAALTWAAPPPGAG